MRSIGQVLGVLVVLVGMGSAAAAQAQQEEASSALCRNSICRFEIEWRNGVPNVIDARYGNPYEFERRLLDHLKELGYAFLGGDGASRESITLRVRPRMGRAMCDQTPGTNTDMSCQTVSEVRVEVLNTNPELDITGSMLVRGRCGADQMMDIERMSEFVAAKIDYEFRKGEERKRPSSKC